jgi:hypothetical protein
VLASPTVTVERNPGTSVRPRLDVLVVAHGQAVEVRTHRTSYRSGWVTTLIVRRPDGSVARSAPLPRAHSTLLGITNFAHAVLSGPRGRIADGVVSWCPGLNLHQAVDPDAAADPVYPEVCSVHPFGFGLVTGIEPGWASAVANRSLFIPASVPDGTYTVTVTVTPAIAAPLGLPKTGRTVVLSLVLHTRPSAELAEGIIASDPLTEAPRPLAAATVVTPDADTLPDLIPLPAYGIMTTIVEGRDQLRFAANTWNAGPGTLVVEGYRVAGTETMDAVQIFYRNGQPVGSAPIGQMVFHHGEGHDHWHFTDFTAYDLTDTARRVVATSGKQAWCMAPTAAVDLTVAGATYRPASTGLLGACGGLEAQWLRELLPVGWGDTYVQKVAGQAIDITDVPNGRYYVRVTVNPVGKVFERNRRNNVSMRLVILGGQPGHRTVKVRAYQGIAFN